MDSTRGRRPFEAVHRYEETPDGVKYTNLRTGETRLEKMGATGVVARDRAVQTGQPVEAGPASPESPACGRARRWVALGRKAAR